MPILTIYTQLKWFIGAHAGFGILQLCLFFFLADVGAYGGYAGFFAHTPLESLFGTDQRADARADNPGALAAVWQVLVDISDTVVSLQAFDYEVVTSIRPDEGLVYYFVMAVRLATWALSFLLGASIFQAVMSSGIMQTPVGLAMVTLGGGAYSVLTGLGLAT